MYTVFIKTYVNKIAPGCKDFFNEQNEQSCLI